MALFKKQKEQPEVAPKELVKRVQALETKVEGMRHAITKIGVTRFNPFKEIGGDQSFCVALLDEANNGIVITSYYGRELNRVYAKPIQGATSEHELSQEEKEAITQAIGQTK